MTQRAETSLKHTGAALARRVRGFFDTLAGRLLALTVTLVIAGEALVFAPALKSFHEAWLQDRINLAQTAALALEVAPGAQIAAPLRVELLENAEVKRIAMKREEERELLLEAPFDDNPGPIRVYDYTRSGEIRRTLWAFETLFARKGRVLRVLARPRFESGEFIEIVLNEAPLKRDMAAFAARFAFASTLILVAAGALVYGALAFAFVRPMRALTQSIERFRDAPEDASISFVQSKRADEIGRAERAAAAMAEQIRASLRQRERLAAMGAAVARIGHDLRNMLATAEIVTERLAKSEDPAVRQAAPRLERAIGRAAGLASNTLRYGRAEEAAPVLRPVRLAEAAREAAQDALIGFPDLPCRIDIDEQLAAIADADHLHRVLVNLMRNAAQAMDGRKRDGAGIAVHGARSGGMAALEIVDHGPGVTDKVQGNLFAPFVSADRAHGGAGLGLAIARELARAMGGDVQLARTSADGAMFRVTLPGA
jgi:signal transduction histidine kinase